MDLEGCAAGEGAVEGDGGIEPGERERGGTGWKGREDQEGRSRHVRDDASLSSRGGNVFNVFSSRCLADHFLAQQVATAPNHPSSQAKRES
jgi:hypothetical protein